MLLDDNWDDWGKYATTFRLIVFDELGVEHNIGEVKIGQAGLAPRSGRVEPVNGVASRRPTLEQVFNALPDDCFSVGQNEDYYQGIYALSPDVAREIFSALRDCAYDLAIFVKYQRELVMRESLLRSVSEDTVKNRFNRLARGDAALSKFHFSFMLPDAPDGLPGPALEFDVTPDSHPPSNVHVLIGRNGVGKTRCMKKLAASVATGSGEAGLNGRIDYYDHSFFRWRFTGLLHVSFSAFDEPFTPGEEAVSLRVTLVGLQEGDALVQPPTPEAGLAEKLAHHFRLSLEAVRSGTRAQRWRDAVTDLESDPLFKEADIASLLEYSGPESDAYATNLFNRLSSGHKIVLLVTTRLVELIDEMTLVLIDEPELHLHPPLLSAFVRALSRLLIKRNGVAIVSTHSPVVLQEVPANCVWKLERSGAIVTAERPTIETFGENVGVLTREVFGLEVTESGFHRMIAATLQEHRYSYDQLLAHFDGQLGAEARAIARALTLERDRVSGDENA